VELLSPYCWLASIKATVVVASTQLIFTLKGSHLYMMHSIEPIAASIINVGDCNSFPLHSSTVVSIGASSKDFVEVT